MNSQPLHHLLGGDKDLLERLISPCTSLDDPLALVKCNPQFGLKFLSVPQRLVIQIIGLRCHLGDLDGPWSLYGRNGMDVVSIPRSDDLVR